MTTWGEYQSAIQLGAALNVGYGVFDLAYRSAASPIIDAFTMRNEQVSIAIEKMKQARSSGQGHTDKIEISASRFQTLKFLADITRKISSYVEWSSPGAPLFSGICCTILLFISSELYAEPLILCQKALIAILGYGWLTLICIAIATTHALYRFVGK